MSATELHIGNKFKVNQVAIIVGLIATFITIMFSVATLTMNYSSIKSEMQLVKQKQDLINSEIIILRNRQTKHEEEMKIYRNDISKILVEIEKIRK